MKSKLNLFILLVISVVALFYNFDNCLAGDINGGGANGGAGSLSNYDKGGFHDTDDIGVRMTVYSESGRRVSDSVDIVFSETTKKRLVGYKKPYTTKTNVYISKVDYIAGYSSSWTETDLNSVLIFVNNKYETCADAQCNSKSIPPYLLRENAKYFDSVKSDWENDTSMIKVMNSLNLCSIGGYTCNDNEHYYAILEPTMYVIIGNYPYYGTAYELAYISMKNSGTSMNDNAYNLGKHINNTLPRTLTIHGEESYANFYKNIKINDFCSDSTTCLSYSSNNKMTKNTILTKGVGISVYDWTEPVRTVIPPSKEDITCNVISNINSCGNSEIKEDTRKECIVNNEVYSYVSGCNLYCSDEITSNFSGVYNTFIGNNKLKAIKSGTYLSMAGNSQITIKKTCYQSQSTNECSDVSQAFGVKLNSDYKNNDIYLNVDGYRYSLNGTPSITNNGYDSATITYTYELNPTTNKYISIEEMKGIYSTVDSYKVIDNGVAKIITKKETYGNYSYSLDISNTALNKYHSASTNLTNYKNATSAEYNFENVITINKNGTAVDKYTTGDLNYSCGYVKYDASSSCICAENQCCDSITCEPVECPPSSCVCTGPYGCKNDGKCTPLPEPTGNGETCDPETSTCFPNIVYRPISLVDPFPGIDGTGRLPGDNWNRVVKIDGKYTSLVDFYIKNNRGVSGYEVYNKEPLYVIELDNTKMKAIRTYNKSHDYNDFELSCINGENCISDFLRGRANGFNINLISSGTCKNITNYDFNSCLE